VKVVHFKEINTYNLFGVLVDYKGGMYAFCRFWNGVTL